MPRSRNNKITKRGTHSQRLKTHDEYLSIKFPDQFNMTNPYSAVVAEMLDEEIAEANMEPNAETIEAMVEAETMTLPRFDTVDELMADLNKQETEEGVQELLLTGEISGTPHKKKKLDISEIVQ